MTEAQYRTLTAGTTRTSTIDTVTNVTGAGYGIAPPAAQLALLQQSYDALKESVYSALVLQTRLNPYLDVIELTFDEIGIDFDTAALASLLDQRKATNECLVRTHRKSRTRAVRVQSTCKLRAMSHAV